MTKKKKTSKTVTDTIWRNDILDQLMHSEATPSVLRQMGDSVQHIFDIMGKAADEIEKLRKKNKSLKKQNKKLKDKLHAGNK